MLASIRMSVMWYLIDFVYVVHGQSDDAIIGAMLLITTQESRTVIIVANVCVMINVVLADLTNVCACICSVAVRADWMHLRYGDAGSFTDVTGKRL